MVEKFSELFIRNKHLLLVEIRVDLCIQSAWERDLTNIRGQQINLLDQRYYYKELLLPHRRLKKVSP